MSIVREIADTVSFLLICAALVWVLQYGPQIEAAIIQMRGL